MEETPTVLEPHPKEQETFFGKVKTSFQSIWQGDKDDSESEERTGATVSTEKPDGSLLDLNLARVGAYIFLWIMGLRSSIQLLTVYSDVFKPLVTAALTVSLLEWIVQIFEQILWKFTILITLLVKKIIDIILLIVLSVLLFAPGNNWKCGMLDLRGRLKKEFFNFSEIKLEWRPVNAGKNIVFRMIGISSALGIVVISLWMITSMITLDVSTFIDDHRAEAYKGELNYLMSNVVKGAQSVPDYLHNRFGVDNNTTHWMHEMIHHYTSDLVKGNHDEAVDWFKDSAQLWLGKSASFLEQLSFYVVYCLMWLMDPLQLNAYHEFEDAARAESGVSLYWHIISKGFWKESGHDLSERPRTSSFQSATTDQRRNFQEKIYGILRVYFLLKVTMNGIFAGFNFLLFRYLKLDLSRFLASICFVLSFIPELGAMIAFVVPLPVCLLMPEKCDVYFTDTTCNNDDRLNCRWNATTNLCDMPASPSDLGGMGKLQQFLILLVGMFAIKMVVSNMAESVVMGRNKTLMGAVTPNTLLKETHPVVIIFAVVFTGEIWGPLGMIICVPLISIIRMAMNFWNYNPKHHDDKKDSKEEEGQCCQSAVFTSCHAWLSSAKSKWASYFSGADKGAQPQNAAEQPHDLTQTLLPGHTGDS